MGVSKNNSYWFTLRTDKINKDGKAPIAMFLIVNDVRLRYSTNLKIYPAYWSVERKEAIYVKPEEAKKIFKGSDINVSANDLLTATEIKDFNSELDEIRIRVNDLIKWHEANKLQYSAKIIIDKLKEQDKAKTVQTFKVEEKTDLVFDYIDRYIIEHEEIREPGSLSVYKSVKNHLKAYQDESGYKVAFENIDYSFFGKFQNFLIKRTKIDVAGKKSPMLNNTTIAKALSTLKTFLSYARKEGIKVNDSYRDFTVKREKLEVIALEQTELQSLIDFDLSSNKRLEKVRDLFVFACATGLRYSDCQQLKREHIDKETINIVVKKTKTALSIPLNEISASVLDKYSALNRPLPIISNQNLNYYIKELCQLAEINRPIEIVRFHGKKRVVNTYPKFELISFHTGRKTFVTVSLEKGMSAEEVMTISGHEDYKSFKRYVNVTEKRKKVVMLKAWGAPSQKHLKVV